MKPTREKVNPVQTCIILSHLVFICSEKCTLYIIENLSECLSVCVFPEYVLKARNPAKPNFSRRRK